MYPSCEPVCEVRADFTRALNAMPILSGKDGSEYKTLNVSIFVLRRAMCANATQYDVCLTFGSTELSARVRWWQDVSISLRGCNQALIS
jgi:hypothetical protein